MADTVLFQKRKKNEPNRKIPSRPKNLKTMTCSHRYKHIPVVDSAKGGCWGTECGCVQGAVCNTVLHVSLNDMPAKGQTVSSPAEIIQMHGQLLLGTQICCNKESVINFPPLIVAVKVRFAYRIILLCSENWEGLGFWLYSHSLLLLPTSTGVKGPYMCYLQTFNRMNIFNQMSKHAPHIHEQSPQQQSGFSSNLLQFAVFPSLYPTSIRK